MVFMSDKLPKLNIEGVWDFDGVKVNGGLVFDQSEFKSMVMTFDVTDMLYKGLD